MKNINDILKELNEEQIKPVLETEGRVLVIAGAGSGKTRVLTSRIAYLIAEKNVSPYEIMAITFTNKAAGEMKKRLTDMVDGDVSGMWVSTIHSMCVRILRSAIDRLSYDKNFTIYDESDKDKALKRVFEETGVDQEKLFKTIKNHISNAKNECFSPEEYYGANRHVHFIEEIYKVYKGYDELLKRSNALDFDDLLYKTYELFKDNPDVAEYYATKFRYVHIDEFQDTNKVQFYLASKLSEIHGNLFVVGDDDQSIYGWRGAKIENILNFDKIYKGAKVFKLERNYRSTKKILQLANFIIKHNTARRDKELWTENNEGVRIESFVGTDENNEASYVAMQIKNLMAKNPDLNYNDFAVFMRLNALSRPFEQEFTKYGIPYRIFGGFRFFERKEIKDVTSYLKIIVNPYDDESFIRAIASPKRGVGDKTLDTLREYAVSRGMSMYHAIDNMEESGISSGARLKLGNFKKLLQSFEEYSKENSISKLIQYVLDNTGFMEQFADKTDENHDRIMNIGELKNSAELYEQENGLGANLVEFLNASTLSSDTDDIKDGNAVTVATIHASKGLEFPIVFIAGLDEKILPSIRSYESDEELEEERRLTYVAVTRAMERLYLTRATSRYMYGRREFMMESRFLKEARPILSPNEYIKEQNKEFYSNKYNKYNDDEILPSVSHGYSSSYAKTMLNDNKPKANASADYTGYRAGVKVKHPKFGEGTVISLKGTGDNLIVDVAFKGIGIKSLSVKYAPMEIIK